ncbi:hypothetical protein Tco_1058593 [Tanacetum coccineum]|uniref:Uncharacterized protein n=1 Tax=Tanacetum coccineum TaxID=301880 RepID=A0ABQ5H9L1_9ASTR
MAMAEPTEGRYEVSYHGAAGLVPTYPSQTTTYSIASFGDPSANKKKKLKPWLLMQMITATVMFFMFHLKLCVSDALSRSQIIIPCVGGGSDSATLAILSVHRDSAKQKEKATSSYAGNVNPQDHPAKLTHNLNRLRRVKFAAELLMPCDSCLLLIFIVVMCLSTAELAGAGRVLSVLQGPKKNDSPIEKMCFSLYFAATKL